MATKHAANRSEPFGRLLSGMISSLAYYEGKTSAAVEEELGMALAVVGKTIQRYKSGYLPPSDEAVRLLAEAAVRRGFLGREWLQRFLHAARYPFAEKLLNELCPAPQVRPRPPRVYENLPAPTYSQFVMRELAFAEVTDGLSKRTAAVLIVGLGGNGKTSLAREVAAHCLREDGETQRFDAVVWVSDKDRPGTTNLTTVLDEVARTLDYPGFTQFEHDEKRREVDQLLRRQRVLLVVDNVETITDGALLIWLLNLPEPSKALITSREKHRGLWSSWLVELRGMSEAEAWALITKRARVLKIDRLIGERVQLEPLLAVTGGNPKALTMTLGLLKYERRPLQEVVDDLYAARGDLFDDLFTRAWALLDEAARRVLLVATFFPTSACGEALSATADVQGFAFDRAVERLADMALLDVQQADLSSLPRYALHPLVRAFAGAKLGEQAGFEAGARERWVGWYKALVTNIEMSSHSLERLAEFDGEQETLFSVIQWIYAAQWLSQISAIAGFAGYYYYVRGLWDKKRQVNWIHAEAARVQGNVIEEIRGLSFLIQLLSLQGNVIDSERHLQRLHELEDGLECSGDVYFTLQHTLALSALARQDVETALIAWEKSLTKATLAHPDAASVVRRMWMATCFHRKGQLTEARTLLLSALRDAQAYAYDRGLLSVQVELASVELSRGDLAAAATLLQHCMVQAYQLQDSLPIASTHQLLARLHTLRSDRPAARASLTEAIDRFERLGMRRELAEARQALADLA